MTFYGRTDLAAEAHRSICERERLTELPGVSLREERLMGYAVSSLRVLDARGEQALGRAVGRYFTLHLDSLAPERFAASARACAALLRRCIGTLEPDCVCIAALGNPDITPDALGPLCASQILVTRHLKERSPEIFGAWRATVLCRTGVLGTSGVESAVQVRSFCEAVGAGLVIAVDALAGSELPGLCRSIQICDTGIAPGSGVGNNRSALDECFLGVPVIAVGVPTVMDASALASDEELSELFVTPRQIDSAVRAAARVIAYGINLALHPSLSPEEITALIG